MTARLVIRKAVTGDLPSLVGLLQMLFRVEADFTPEPEKQQRGLELLLADKQRSLILLVEVDGRIAGMCTAQLVASTAEGALSGWIEDLILDEDCRGCGIGRYLLTAVEDWCFKQGATRIQLLADRENTPALLFYAKLGWATTQLIGLRKVCTPITPQTKLNLNIGPGCLGSEAEIN
jgi:GNAT superfamily N-acetyltransferase